MSITIEALKARLSYDPITGEFRWAKNHGRMRAGDKAGTRHPKGYTRLNLDGKFYYAHRVAWFYVYGEWPKALIDHIDGNPSNDAIANLRQCENSENLCNRGPQRNNTSGAKGVYYRRDRSVWVANIWARKKKYHIGEFATIEQAQAAYEIAATQLHGEFACQGKGLVR